MKSPKPTSSPTYSFDSAERFSDIAPATRKALDKRKKESPTHRERTGGGHEFKAKPPTKPLAAAPSPQPPNPKLVNTANETKKAHVIVGMAEMVTGFSKNYPEQCGTFEGKSLKEQIAFTELAVQKTQKHFQSNQQSHQDMAVLAFPEYYFTNRHEGLLFLDNADKKYISSEITRISLKNPDVAIMFTMNWKHKVKKEGEMPIGTGTAYVYQGGKKIFSHHKLSATYQESEACKQSQVRWRKKEDPTSNKKQNFLSSNPAGTFMLNNRRFGVDICIDLGSMSKGLKIGETLDAQFFLSCPYDINWSEDERERIEFHKQIKSSNFVHVESARR